ncbi:hypothetical protein [Embleya scabrispora]|uniref:hypothetical protein n=1 Tax=Embleya scabrispora TaxID=159449 RepID=UPI0003A778C6|nr:hypothetical protein [Embleya scabrispora]
MPTASRGSAPTLALCVAGIAVETPQPIRYRTKPEAAEENQRLIENVFAEPESTAPPGLRYSSFRLTDGVTFVHVVDGDGLAESAAFREFQRNLGRDRARSWWRHDPPPRHPAKPPR